MWGWVDRSSFPPHTDHKSPCYTGLQQIPLIRCILLFPCYFTPGCAISYGSMVESALGLFMARSPPLVLKPNFARGRSIGRRSTLPQRVRF